MNNMLNLYSQVLLEDGSHVTLEFNPDKCKIPSPLHEGQEVYVIQKGYYKDKDIEADIVDIYTEPIGHPVMSLQSDGITPLHITRLTSNGVPPVQAGIRARENGYVFDLLCNPIRQQKGTVCFYRVNTNKE